MRGDTSVWHAEEGLIRIDGDRMLQMEGPIGWHEESIHLLKYWNLPHIMPMLRYEVLRGTEKGNCRERVYYDAQGMQRFLREDDFCKKRYRRIEVAILLQQVVSMYADCESYMVTPQQILWDPQWTWTDGRGKLYWVLHPWTNTQQSLEAILSHYFQSLYFSDQEELSYVGWLQNLLKRGRTIQQWKTLLDILQYG